MNPVPVSRRGLGAVLTLICLAAAFLSPISALATAHEHSRKASTTVLGRASSLATGSAVAADTAADVGKAEQYVYRIHGGDAGPMGHSWTPENPMGMANPRDVLGLPKANSGQMLTRARVLNTDGVATRDALPIPEDGVTGGGPEWLFPDPAGQLEVHWTIPLVPPW